MPDTPREVGGHASSDATINDLPPLPTALTTPADPLSVITRVLEECRTLIPAVQAEHVLGALQGLYVPPPPGSERDALPPHLRVLIAPHMPRYESTACQTERACRAAARAHPEHAEELLAWADREHLACRRTRKQDMAECGAPCHGTGRPVAPAVDPQPGGSR